MKITPLEIRQKDFEKKLRGYDKDEVNAFLQSLSNEWERMLEENKDLNIKLQQAEREVKKLREVESSLYKTLKTAEETGANVIEQANKAAELHMKETQMNAEALLNESKNKARAMIEQAEVEARQIIEELQEAVKNLEQNHRDIENQREMALQELKNLSVALIEKVERNTQEPKEFRFDDYIKRVKKLAKESDQRIKAEKTSVEVKSKIVENLESTGRETESLAVKPTPTEKESESVGKEEEVEEKVTVETKVDESKKVNTEETGNKEKITGLVDSKQLLESVQEKKEPIVDVKEPVIVESTLSSISEPMLPKPVDKEDASLVVEEETRTQEKKGPRIARTVSFFDELDTDN